MTSQHLPTQAIIHFWFGDRNYDAVPLKTQMKRWFGGGPATDHEVKARFGEWLKPAAAMPAESFEIPDAALAGIILLDQFSRHVYRGQAAAFAFDDKAVALLERALEHDWDKELHPVEQSFLYMPLQHIEDLAMQRKSVAQYQALLARARAANEAPAVLDYLQEALDYALLHEDIIVRFGRFPHRNRALGRQNSPDEEEYLQTAKRFGQ